MKKSIDVKPLVSVIVITYNSEKHVLETLESIYDQTYQNIELIITDDYSQDQTIVICKEWLDQNKERFVSIKLVQTENNTGIPGNLNRGLNCAKGKWIKFIAGDDALYDNAIYDSIKFVDLKKEIRLFSSEVNTFIDNFDDASLVETNDESILKFYELDSKSQYSELLKSNKIPAVSMFIQKEILDEISGFDERFRFIEDHPLWLKITKKGHKIYYMNSITTKYRIHAESVQNVRENSNMIYSDFYRRIRSFQKVYIYPNISFWDKFILDYEYYRLSLLDRMKLNKNNFLGKSANYLSKKIHPKNF